MATLAVAVSGILKSRRQKANDFTQAGPPFEEKRKVRQSGEGLLEDRDLADVEEDPRDPSRQGADDDDEALDDRSWLQRNAAWTSVATIPVTATRTVLRRGRDFVFQTGPYADETAGMVIPQYR